MDDGEGSGDWMPSRPLLRRLLQYRSWLASGRGFTMQEAIETLEASEHTVYRDLNYARTLGWDIEFCRRRHRWVKGEGDLPLPLVTLPEGEIVALLVAEEALRAYAGTPYAAALRSAFEKLRLLLDAPVSLDMASAPLPRFTEPPARPVEAAQFEALCAACRERRRLEITYHTLARDEVTTRRVDPYHVFAHGGDWYLVAYDYHRERYTTFALGQRMREIGWLGEHYTLDPAFDLDRYLAEGFGVFRGGPVEDVVLRFSPSVACYLRERVWAENEEKEELPDDGLLLKMRVPVNVGLLRFVLQYGDEVAVEAPETFRTQVSETLAKAARKYR